MKNIKCLVVAIVCLQAGVHSMVLRDYNEDLNLPDVLYMECTPNGKTVNMLVFNKVEIVNRLDEYPLASLLSHRGIMPEDNTELNNYLYCIWKKKRFFTTTGDLNYGTLESVIKDAIVKTVGSSGPAIKLSMVHAKQIVDECRAITGSNIGNRVAKVQNHIVRKLQAFAEI